MAAVEHGGGDIEIMVEFDDDDDGCLLSETQKSKGLTRTFLSVNSEVHKTISDLRSYIIDTLPLQNICPNDILLSINGLSSLLPSEQTCKLNNKVIRCVKKTTTAPLPIDKDKVTGGCQSDIDRSEDDPKKRKATALELEDNQLSNKKKTNCTTIEASPVAPQHVENDIHVKQNEPLDSPGSDESDLDRDECLDKLSEKSLGMSAGDVYLMRSTCSFMGRHYGPMSVLYYIRCMLLRGFHDGVVDVVGIKILLDKVKDSLKGLQDVDVNYYECKSTETSRNDDPAVEPVVDAEGSKKSMELDDTKGAESLESIQPSGGALKFAQGIVAFCKLIPKKRFHLVFLEEIEFHDLVLGIIDDIITADDLARAHQLFEDKYADIMLSKWSDDDDE